MQSIRLATRAAPRASRALATAAQHPLPASAQHASAASPSGTPVSLSNIEAQWERLSVEEQAQVHAQLEEVQKKDWKSLSIDEKKAGACCSERSGAHSAC
jgi:cytochrome c oxidase subunit 4